jgi:acetyltransferase-like isoleucine patch superfamily enzyme
MSEPNGTIALDAGLTLSMGKHSCIHDRRIRNLSGTPVHVSIGKFCSVAADLAVVGADDHPEWITMYPFLHELRRADWPGTQAISSPAGDGGRNVISIGNDVWIGCGVKLFRGITIGDGAIIGANSSVTASVQPYTIVAGSPAQVVQKRFTDGEIAFLQRIRWWDWTDELINQRLPFLCSAKFSELERILQNEPARDVGKATENTAARTAAPVPPGEPRGRPAANAAQDFASLRARLGRMLGRPAPISESELHAANLALVAAIKARDPMQHIAGQRSDLPAAMAPLLLTHLASAWTQGDKALAAVLENLHRCLVQPQAAGVAA